MLKIFRNVSVLVLSAPLLWAPSIATAGYDTHPKAKQFVQEMVSEHNMQPELVKSMLAEADKKQVVLDAISRPAEKTKQWWEYRNIFMQSSRIAQGKVFMNRYHDALVRAEQTYQVPKEIITAIIGVETFYGRNKGSFRVIDALSTLAFDYPKRPLFYRELKQYMLLVQEENLAFDEVKGSYAGAMGLGQFIPSSFRRYAVDFDGDGVKDIWNNPVDAIGSVANYFYVHGWKPNGAVFMSAAEPTKKAKDWVNESQKPSKTIAEFAKQGMKLPEATMNQKQELAVLLRYEHKHRTEHLFGLTNFYVITRYNRSRLYARAVYELSQAIKE